MDLSPTFFHLLIEGEFKAYETLAKHLNRTKAIFCGEPMLSLKVSMTSKVDLMSH